VDVLFDFGIVQHIPWTWITSVNGVLVFDKVRLTKIDKEPVEVFEPTKKQGERWRMI
jgi:hypothetical protein